MKRLIHIACFLLLISACREPFDFEYPDVEQGRIVIEGYLTDEAGEHLIRVSESTRLGDFNGVEPRYIEDAAVRIVDDQGVQINFIHRRNGEYYSDELAQAQEGRSYKLEVTLADGRYFESESEVLPEGEVAPIDLSYELGNREILVNGSIQTEEVLLLESTISKETTDRYYIWEIREYFIKEADFGPGNLIEEELLLPDTVPLRFCYVRDYPKPNVYVHKDQANSQNTGSQYPVAIDYISVDSRWEYEFILMVRQLSTDVDAFNYWEQISEFANNSGSLFDPFPSTVIGNIDQVNGTEKALGYFGVYKTSFFRKKLRLIDLGISEMLFFPCTPPQRPGPSPCLDCRLYPYADNFFNNKPEWWDE